MISFLFFHKLSLVFRHQKEPVPATGFVGRVGTMTTAHNWEVLNKPADLTQPSLREQLHRLVQLFTMHKLP